ncbi:hypothetical protein BT96DRAFT_999346 [Gymnopus androsaceus JB14]|uniref:Uncharacterized protein n=1 Tax=Gymnopus androsaceus JB14 TaxID=1447944 RepID=A0A6A4H767_9AGAR|nr:hypothetical protein BT96DRAFT_999346 [Gymnopus androsaceus JB14]
MLFEEIETKDYKWAVKYTKPQFKIRCLDLPAARKILGSAIGLCPEEKLSKSYIELETDFNPANASTWIKYAQIESQLEDFARARAITKLGISHPTLSMPELLRKAYIDFEIEEDEQDTARSLYGWLISLRWHEKSYRLSLWRSHGIPDNDHQPFNIPYTAV